MTLSFAIGRVFFSVDVNYITFCFYTTIAHPVGGIGGKLGIVELWTNG